MKYNDIIDKLKDIINEISGIQIVYTEAPESPEQYPCVVIRPNGHTNEIRSLRDNVREYSFTIDIIGNLTEKNSETQIKVRNLTDAVIDALEAQINIALGGVVDWADATAANFRYQLEPTKLYISEITYRVKVRYNRHS